MSKSLEYTLTLNTSEAVTIFTDSLSSLQAIDCRRSVTPLVVRIQELLTFLRQRGTDLAIYWVKAHAGYIGNERADQLARDCFSIDATFVYCDAPVSFVRRHLFRRAIDTWNRHWITSTKGRWTFAFFPTVEYRRKILNMTIDFVTTQFLTAHGKFGSYLYHRHCRDNSNCACGDHQTVEHLVFE